MKSIWILILIILVLSPSLMMGDSVLLDGESDMDDAYLDSNVPNTSRGTELWMYGKCLISTCVYTIVMKFDLTGISGTIDSVSLKLHRHLPADDEQMYFYRLTRDWVEVEGYDPQVTWDSASTGCPSCAAWTTAGGDYNSTKIDSLNNKGAEAVNQNVYCQRGKGVGLAQLVQDWIDGMYSNYGVLIKSAVMGAGDTLYFYTSENISNPRPTFYI